MRQPRSARARRAVTHASGGGKRHHLTAGAVHKYLAALGAKGGSATGPTKRAGAKKAWRTKRAAAVQLLSGGGHSPKPPKPSLCLLLAAPALSTPLAGWLADYAPAPGPDHALAGQLIGIVVVAAVLAALAAVALWVGSSTNADADNDNPNQPKE